MQPLGPICDGLHALVLAYLLAFDDALFSSAWLIPSLEPSIRSIAPIVTYPVTNRPNVA